MLFWSSFLFVHRHYWTSPVNHPQDIPTKELQSLYIFTMSVTHCDRGKGGAPPRPLPPSGPFASLRSSANFCMSSLHIVLHFSLNCSLCVTNSIYLFNNIQANSLFLLICKGIWKLTLTELAFTSLWMIFISIMLKFWLLAHLDLEQTSEASIFT